MVFVFSSKFVETDNELELGAGRRRCLCVHCRHVNDRGVKKVREVREWSEEGRRGKRTTNYDEASEEWSEISRAGV
jgi:hypothetical protein